MARKVVFEDVCTSWSEDGGAARIAEVFNKQVGMFVRLHSWDPDEKLHSEMKLLEGKKIRLTLEVID